MDVKIEITNADEKWTKEWVTGGINLSVLPPLEQQLNTVADVAIAQTDKKENKTTKKVDNIEISPNRDQRWTMSCAVFTVYNKAKELFALLEINGQFFEMYYILSHLYKKIDNAEKAASNRDDKAKAQIRLNIVEYDLLVACLNYYLKDQYDDCEFSQRFHRVNRAKETISWLEGLHKCEEKNGD